MGVHMIAVSYIPNPDPEALAWLENFSSTAEIKPTAFGIDPRDVASLAGLIRDFREKLEVAGCPETRTSPAITAKIIARNAAVQAVKRLVKAIKAHPLTIDEDLRNFGLPLPHERRKVVPAPQTAPILTVRGAAGVNGSHRLTFADSLTPESRRKPDGVMHLQLYVAVGPALVNDPVGGRAAFHSLITRSPFDVHHDPADSGKMATYFGRWSTRTGLTGPWSIPVGMTIVFVQRG